MRTCPECRADVRAEANFCPACGTFLGWHERPPSSPAPAAPVPVPGPSATPAPRAEPGSRAHGVVLELAEESVELQPGGTAQVALRVCNTGQVVDEFDVRVRGDAADWTEVDPTRVAVYPRAEETVTVRFRPPRAPTVPAGLSPVTVVAQSVVHAGTSACAEGVLEIAAYDDLSAALSPHVADGRGLTRHRFIVSNRGNRDRTVELPPHERQGGVRVVAKPPVLTVPPGSDGVVGIDVRSGWRWWGAPRQHAFTVRARSRDGVALSGSATSTQHAVLPAWALRLLLGALVLLAALLVWLQIAGELQALAGRVGDALSAFGRDVAQVWDNLKNLGSEEPADGEPPRGPTDVTSTDQG